VGADYPTHRTQRVGLDRTAVKCAAARDLVEVPRCVLRGVEGHSRHRARVRVRVRVPRWGEVGSLIHNRMRDKHQTLPPPQISRNAMGHEVQLDTPLSVQRNARGQ
jgi:hypothetical protein